MATVAQITAAYDNVLLPVLDDGPGVCVVCASTSGDFTLCWQCDQARQALDVRADVVVPVALAVKGGQLARELSAYKNSNRQRARVHMRNGLAAVLWRWLSRHEGCVARRVGVGGFRVVTNVPSTSGRSEDPVADILKRIVGATRDRYETLLESTPGVPGGRDARRDRYSATRRLNREPVLLIDDTWTTGGHAQSAAYALKKGGAGPVGVVIMGRHFSAQQPEPYRESAEEYLKQSRAQGWDWDRCRLDRGC